MGGGGEERVNESNLASLPLDFPPILPRYSLPAQSAPLETDIMATYFETVQKVRLSLSIFSPSRFPLHDTTLSLQTSSDSLLIILG